MFVSDTTRVHLLNPSWVCSGPLLTSSCLPTDGGEGAEVSCGFIPPTAAWEGAQHSHCGGLRTLCSIIMTSTSVSISHHSSFRLRNLYALPLLKQRNQFFGQPVSFKYPVEAAQFPVYSLLQPNLVLGFPRAFVLAFPGITISHSQQL